MYIYAGQLQSRARQHLRPVGRSLCWSGDEAVRVGAMGNIDTDGGNIGGAADEE